MDTKAFRKLSYGLYIVTSANDGHFSGCVANTFTQVTSDPAQVCITLNRDNYTTGLIENSCVYHVCIMNEDVPMDTIRHFGFQSGRDVDKFKDIDFKTDTLNLKYPVGHMGAHFSVKVNKIVELSTHIMFIGEVVDCFNDDDGQVLTYAAYHQLKNGTTPKNSPSYIEEEAKSGWRCSVCGYIYEGDELPEDFTCPVCHQPASVFEKIGK